MADSTHTAARVWTGRLANWDGTAPDLRSWSDEEILSGLAQLGISTDRTLFAQAAAEVTLQSDLEDDWLQFVPVGDENMQVFAWMSVQELWQRWELPLWPKDRLARMFAYLVDSDAAVDWADKFTSPPANAIFDALEAELVTKGKGNETLVEMAELLGMPGAAWPSKMLDAMAEWAEIGNLTLAERGGRFMTSLLGNGHPLAYLSAALVSARMYDRAQAASLQVPLDAPLVKGFDELVGYLCLCAGDALLAGKWLRKADQQSQIRRSEMTLAAETVRDYLAEVAASGEADGSAIPAKIQGAAKQAASQACYYAFMAFAGSGVAGGV